MHELLNGQMAGEDKHADFSVEVLSNVLNEAKLWKSALLSFGSMSLHLGNEVFDVYKAPLQGDHNHLFIRQGTGLQGQAVFKTKLTFRCVSLSLRHTHTHTHTHMLVFMVYGDFP